MSESSMQHYRDQVVAVAVRQNVKRIGQFDAFRVGYRDSSRLRRWGFEPADITANDAQTIRPRTTSDGVGNLSAYVQGWMDGMNGDTFRLESIVECERQGLRF